MIKDILENGDVVVSKKDFIEQENEAEKWRLAECGGIDGWDWLGESLEEYRKIIDVISKDGKFEYVYEED